MTLSTTRVVRLSTLAVALLTAWGASRSALAQSNQFQFSKKADTSAQVPNQPGGTLYNNFGLPSIHKGTVAFRATYPNPNDNSDLNHNRVDKVLSNGTIVEVLNTPNLPTSSVPDLIVGDVTLFGNDVGFSGPTANVSGATHFRTNGSVLSVVNSSVGGRATYHDQHVAYPINPSSGTGRIRVEGQVVSATAVLEGDPVPQGNGLTFAAFGPYVDHNISSIPVIQNRSVAFLGFWATGNFQSGGIYRWQQTGPQTGTVIRVADANVSVPGQAGTFDEPNFGALNFYTTHLDNAPFIPALDELTPRPSLYGSTVAFSFDDSDRAGAYTHNNSGVLTVVADKNTQHPTLGGTFNRFEGVSTVGSATAFVASGFVSGIVASGPERAGLYLKRCGHILEIVREGQILDGKEVANVELGHRGLAVSGPAKLRSGIEVAFRVEFTDFSEGIYTARHRQACAAPGSLIGSLLKPFDPADPDDGPIGDLNFFQAPIYDDGISILESSLAASSSDGAPVVFGGDLAAGLFGVEGPGANDDLIDFAPNGVGVVTEQISVGFNQPALVDAVHLAEFGPTDSALIQIGGQSIRVTGLEAPDGNVSLGGLPLGAGETITIGWDPLNAAGDGFSYGGLLFTAVPEPASGAMALTLVALAKTLGGCLRRARRSQ